MIFSVILGKNQAYGNSALDPVRIFSSASVVEQILVRLDDKVSRIMRGGSARDHEDTFLDLTGYLVLLCLALDDFSAEGGSCNAPFVDRAQATLRGAAQRAEHILSYRCTSAEQPSTLAPCVAGRLRDGRWEREFDTLLATWRPSSASALLLLSYALIVQTDLLAARK